MSGRSLGGDVMKTSHGLVLIGLLSATLATGETALQSRARRLGGIAQAEGITAFENSSLGGRLPPEMTRALTSYDWVPTGASPRGCFAPESQGSLRALVDRMRRENVPYHVVRQGEFLCLTRACADEDVERFVADNPKVVRVEGQGRRYFGGSGKRGATSALRGCSLTGEQRNRIESSVTVVEARGER